MQFTAYDTITGQILFRGDADDPSAMQTQDVSILVGYKYQQEGWIAEEKFNPLPPQPSSWHIFDYSSKEWVDPRTLNTLREEAYVRIQKWRDAQEALPFVFEHAGREWDGGLATRQRLQPVLGLQTLPDGFFWTAANNEDVPMTLESLRQLGAAHEQALVIRGFEIHARQRAIKNAVASAASIEQVQSIEIGYSSQ